MKGKKGMKAVITISLLALVSLCLCAAVTPSASSTVIEVTPATDVVTPTEDVATAPTEVVVTEPTEVVETEPSELPEESIEWAYTDGSVFVYDERIVAINGNYHIQPDNIWLDEGTYTVTLIDGETDYLVVDATGWSCESLM
jgi:hypothetical protein